MEHGETYHCVVTATNGAGITRTVSSPSWAVDLSQNQMQSQLSSVYLLDRSGVQLVDAALLWIGNDLGDGEPSLKAEVHADLEHGPVRDSYSFSSAGKTCADLPVGQCAAYATADGVAVPMPLDTLSSFDVVVEKKLYDHHPNATNPDATNETSIDKENVRLLNGSFTFLVAGEYNPCCASAGGMRPASLHSVRHDGRLAPMMGVSADASASVALLPDLTMSGAAAVLATGFEAVLNAPPQAASTDLKLMGVQISGMADLDTASSIEDFVFSLRMCPVVGDERPRIDALSVSEDGRAWAASACGYLHVGTRTAAAGPLQSTYEERLCYPHLIRRGEVLMLELVSQHRASPPAANDQ
jgi:hypothetical protein